MTARLASVAARFAMVAVQLASLAALVMAAAVVPPASADPAALDREVQGPIAVMPFRNLNDQPDLEWLSAGIAETMISDMRSSGAVEVVERAQLDQALAELALQGLSATDESTAAKVGRMVGAKTIVVGGYQTAGKRLRITARFVRVETGLIVGAAKVTGRLEKVLELQDAIVGELLGRKKDTPKKRAWKPPKKRRSNEQEVKAYRYYAMSLTTASDAQRVTYLKKSVEIDPDFQYALDDLKALEERMKGYRKEAERHTQERLEGGRGVVADPSRTVDERIMALQLLMGELMGRMDTGALLNTARWAESLSWPAPARPRVESMLMQQRLWALQSIERYSLALQVGEAFMARYPHDPQFVSVQRTVEMVIQAIRHREEQRGKWPAELAEKREDQAELEQDRVKWEAERTEWQGKAEAARAALADAVARLAAADAEAPPEAPPDAALELRRPRQQWEQARRRIVRDQERAQRALDSAERRTESLQTRIDGLRVRHRNLESNLCVWSVRHYEYAFALEACNAWLDKWKDDPDNAQQVFFVRHSLLDALRGVGRCDEARTLGEALLEETEESSYIWMIRGALMRCPEGWDGKL